MTIKAPVPALVLFLFLAGLALATPAPVAPNAPEILRADPRVRLTFGADGKAIEGGLQPSMVITRTGAIIVQSQVPDKPFPSKRIAYHSAMETVISRDQGVNWTRIPLTPGENGLDMEGGAVQLRDGSILALDTFVTPGPQPGTGAGQLYFSTDDWRTLQGPVDITFDLPEVNFHGSTDDGGTPHAAVRLHRRILELPNGDLLTTLYGWFKGDDESTGYMPTMHKTRSVLVRSTNQGRHWTMVSTIAVDRTVGTEGFGEPVLVRINSGAHAGRLICQMRTGRELREAVSDDEGRTWSKAQPRVYADLDVYRTEKWVEMFRGVKDKHGRPIVDNPVELIGSVVDPDLLVLRSGVVVATFGVRVPPRACWPRAEHPWNGNYLAVSLDQGKTWSHVVRITSGILTTHYTAIEETPQDNQIFLAYDLGDWSSGRGRSTHGRMVQIAVDPAVAAAPQAGTAGTPLATTPPATNALDALLPRLKTAAELGMRYVEDDLSTKSQHPVPLLVHTNLADPAHCGRRARGWAVDGGVADAYTYAVVRDFPMLGNRSQLSQFSFRSTQTGVPRGEHGLVEMRLCRGTTSDDLPVRIRVEDGRFYILEHNRDNVLAGDRQKPVFTMSADTVYTLKVLLFEKAVYARLSGADVPGGAMELVIPDRYRFIPGRPGFGLRPNAQATGGELAVFDWSVTPVGPAANCRLAAIGDSITAGVDREPEAESYVYLTTRALGQELVLNTGTGGARTALNVDRLPYEIAPFRPKILWIESGGGDMTDGLSADVAFQNMRRQAELAAAWGGKAVLSTVAPLVLTTDARYAERDRLNRLIRESGLPYVDRDAVLRDPADPRHIRKELVSADGIHPTRAGHALVAEEAIRVFRKL